MINKHVKLLKFIKVFLFFGMRAETRKLQSLGKKLKRLPLFCHMQYFAVTLSAFYRKCNLLYYVVVADSEISLPPLCEQMSPIKKGRGAVRIIFLSFQSGAICESQIIFTQIEAPYRLEQ
jgi:hypothetical protein